MVADFTWVEFNTTAGDTGVATNLNLGSTNARNLATSTYPITAGTYSYSKWLTGHWGGTFTRIENIQFWASNTGPCVSGEIINFNGTTGTYDGTDTWAEPTTAVEAKGGTMRILCSTDAGVTSAPGSANIGIGGSLTGSLVAVGYSDFIIVQASIGSGASPGATNQKTFTLQYDEV